MRSLTPPGLGDNTPQIINDRGQQFIPRPAACTPPSGLIKKVTGAGCVGVLLVAY